MDILNQEDQNEDLSVVINSANRNDETMSEPEIE